MKKPPIFRLRDSFYGFIGLAGLGLALYVQLVSPDAGLQAHALMWVVGALLALTWPFRIYMRWDLNRRIDFVTSHRVCVFKHGYNITAEDCERVVEEMLSKWPDVSEGGGEHSYANAYNALVKDYNYVSFEEGPYLDHKYLNGALHKFAGLTTGRTSRVAFDNPDFPIERTAYDHEVGHIAYAVIVHNWYTNEQFHAFAKKYHLGV